MIHGRGIGFSYTPGGRRALDGVDLDAERGEWLAVLGRNGSGKSTLARHMNALLPLQEGELTVAGIDLRRSDPWALRRKVGMVFQNPDNQFVSSLVAEDVAFGPENYGLPRAEIDARVRSALRRVGMEDFARRSPHTLSGGQKQRVAIAGALALEPELMIFDEATAMLDPEGREEVLGLIASLHAEGRTVLMITHYVEEAARADRVILLDGGRIRADGPARAVLTDSALLASAGLLPPFPVRIRDDLARAGISLAPCPLRDDELTEALCNLCSNT